MKGIAVFLSVLAICLALVALMDEPISRDIDVRIINGSGAICNNGYISLSTGRGTCSHHDGVREWVK